MKRAHFAILVIFLVASKELCSAYNLRRITNEDRDVYKEKVFYRLQQRERRSIGAILFGVALFASMANIAFDIYLQIEGCCGIIDDICDYQRKFNESRTELTTVSSQIDTVWTLSQNLLTYVQKGSNQNDELALEMKRITQKYETIIEAVDTDIINGYINKTNDLKTAVEEKNTTVLQWTSSELNVEFDSLFDTSLGRLQILSGLVSSVAGATLTYVWNWYKLGKMQTMLKTNYGHQLTNIQNSKAVKILGGVDADAFIKETAQARRSADLSTSRGAKAMNVANGVMSLVQIGVEIWMAVLKVEQCKDKRDSIKDAYEQLKPEVIDMRNLKAEIDENYNNMTKTWTFIVDQMKGEEFLGYLAQIKNLTDAASTQSKKMKSASAQIQSFIDNVPAVTNKNGLYDMQEQLIWALENVTFTLDCYYKKVKTFTVSSDRCKQGLDTLANIYKGVVSEFDTNSAECTTEAGVKFTTSASVEIYVKAQAAAQGFQEDCQLNDVSTGSLICSRVCSQSTDAQIETELKTMGTVLTLAQIAKIRAVCPLPCILNPQQKNQICLMKAFVKLPTWLIAFPAPTYNPADVEAQFNACP